MAMPHDYPMKENGGKAIISRDFFPTMCPSQLNDDWATKTIKFRPWFEKARSTKLLRLFGPITKLPKITRRAASHGWKRFIRKYLVSSIKQP